MFTKLRRGFIALLLTLLVASCDNVDNRDDQQDKSPAASRDLADIYSRLRQPGKVTHVRYTTYTPPWPTRTDAWIDWDNNRTRSWNVQWTDSPTNPSICTSIRHDVEWYPCLPTSFKVEPEDLQRVSTIYPDIPLRASDSELNLPFPQGFFDDSVDETRVQISPAVTTTETAHGDAKLVVRTQRITSALDLPCREEGSTASANFEYTATEEGEPISEFITLSCGAESGPYFGVFYHEIEFVDPSEVPDDFFDVDATRTSIIEDHLSSAAAQLGSVFWLGEQVGEWKLEAVNHEVASASAYYSREDGEEELTAELTTRTPGTGRLCPDAEPIPGGALDGSLCTIDDFDAKYRVVWTTPGFDVFLETDSYPEPVGREDVLALAANLKQWGRKAGGPLLNEESVSDLVSDSLELVCPSKRLAIREARSDASFEFSRTTGEWTGTFGSFGEIAVPDSKPVAIPVNNREEVESTLSHNAAQFADCTADEQPPPQDGDDEFGVAFMGKDGAGFSFQITGVDTDTDAALSFCIFDEARCVLTDPGGGIVRIRGAEVDDVRANVVRVHVPLGEEELSRTGEWKFSLDLGYGRKTEVTFDVQ